MNSPMEMPRTANDQWKLSAKVGESMVECRPTFTTNNRCLLVASETAVLVVNDVGSVERRLVHPSPVVSVLPSQHDHNQLFSCTLCGVVTRWAADSGKQLQRVSLTFDRVALMAAPKADSWLFVAREQRAAQYNVCEVGLASDRTPSPVHTTLVYDVPPDDRMISFTSTYVVYCKENQLIRQDLIAGAISECYKLKRDGGRSFSSTTCHETLDCIAAGDDTGRILIWSNVSNCGLDTKYTQMIHWHKMPVNDLALSLQGGTLLSCGDEGVLVRYVLHARGHTTRQFLPRVGAPILRVSLSADNSRIAAALRDNSILVAEGQLKTLFHVAPLLRSRFSAPPVGLVADGARLLTNARPGIVQFFSPDDHHTQTVDTLDVCTQNAPPAERDRDLPWAEVAKAAVSADGDWLVTVQCRSDTIAEQSDDVLFKFWAANTAADGSRRFILNSCFEHPHRGVINEILMRPPDTTPSVCLTCGSDAVVKVWHVVETSHKPKLDDVKVMGNEGVATATNVAVEWVLSPDECRYRNLPATCGSFSGDGSCVAIGFSHVLTIWRWSIAERRPAELLADDVPLFPIETLRRVIWCSAGVDATTLLCQTDRGSVLGYDAVTLSPRWSVSAQAAASIPPVPLVYHPDTSTAAIVERDKAVLFRPYDGKPLVLYDLETSVDFVAATFLSPVVDTDEDASNPSPLLPTLYMLAENTVLYALEPPSSRVVRQRRRTMSLSKVTPFSKLLDSTRQQQTVVDDVMSVTDDDKYVMLQTGNLKLFDGAAHTLPSMDILGPMFINSCLTKKTN